VLWAWLYVTADSHMRMAPGLSIELKRRRFRLTLFSRLLKAERNEHCPRCLFARWLEYTQLSVAKREMVRCARNRHDARLLGRCFQAMHGGITASLASNASVTDTDEAVQDVEGERYGGGMCELRWATELDRWATKVFRPETFASWLRRKHRWVKRRKRRLASESRMRVALLEVQTSLKERVRHVWWRRPERDTNADTNVG